MTRVTRSALVALAGFVVALGTAHTASAAPECTDVGETVTFCETNGSTQLITTPPPWNWGGWQGIGFWPLVGGYGLGFE